MMTNTFDDDLTDDFPIAEFLSTDTILLTVEQINRAIQASQRGQGEAKQWQFYVEALALEGIQDWFQKRSPGLSLNRLEQSEVYHTSTDNIPWGQVQIGSFRVNWLVVDALHNSEVAIPTVAITHPDGMAHFYVLVAVQEDLEQVTVGGYLRRDRLLRQLPLPLPTDGVCWVETAHAVSSDRLLLELQVLNPSAIPLVAMAPSRVQEDRSSAWSQQAINTGLWLRNQLDQVAQELAWVLLPPIAMPSMLRPTRTPEEQLNILVSGLSEQRGVYVPSQARSAYTTVREGDRNFYLYAITWEMPNVAHPSEWSLMTILAAPSGISLPAHTSLTLLEGQEILVEQRVEHPTDGGYLYAHVGGGQGEQFSVQIQFPNQSIIQLPPFRFDQGEEG